MVNAKVRAIAVYSDISGDRAPDLPGGIDPNAGAINVTGTAGPLVRRISALERLEEMKAARALRSAPQAAIAAPAPQPTPIPETATA